MRVTIEGFGSIWSVRRRADPDRPELQRVTYYNTTGVSVNGRLRHRSRWPGQLRFNGIRDFNAAAVERNIGHVFECRGTLERKGAQLFLRHLATGPGAPDYFLFAVTSGKTGELPLTAETWKSADVLTLALSECGLQQEALVLMPAHSWIRGRLGVFVAEPEPERAWRAWLRLVG